MSAAGLIWISAAISGAALLLLALCRKFQIDKISVIGFDFKFDKPIEYGGNSHLRVPGIVLLAAGLLISGYGGYRNSFPDVWPESFRALKRAEMQLSDVDDFMFVSINNQPVAKANYGDTPAWIDIK